MKIDGFIEEEWGRRVVVYQEEKDIFFCLYICLFLYLHVSIEVLADVYIWFSLFIYGR